MAKRTIDAPWVDLDQIQLDFNECLQANDRRSLRAILRIAIEQIEARPIDDSIVPAIILFLGLSLSAAIAVYWYESLHHRHWQMMYEGIAAAILTVVAYYGTSRWLSRINRAEIKRIKRLCREFIEALIRRRGFEFKPLPKREFEFLEKLAKDDQGFGEIVSPIILLGGEDVSFQFVGIDL
jgi:hypothetical protein